MQGADRVNDELEVGFDERFERRWVRAEQVGRVLSVLFVLAGLAGLMGRGPYSHRTAHSSEAALAIDFEPVARAQAPTQVTLHLDNPGSSPSVDVLVSTNIVEPMGLTRILPEPIISKAVQNGLLLTIPVPPGTQDAMVRLFLQPAELGPHEMLAKLAGRDPLRWSQFVMP